MEISVSCSCGKSFKAKPALAGKKVACPACKAPISIPEQELNEQNKVSSESTVPGSHVPAIPAPPETPPPTQAPEILITCACQQQFKVDAQYAGQQANCPACQSLCFIPHPSPAPTAFSQPIQPIPAQQPAAIQQPIPVQPAPVQQPIQPVTPMQPIAPQQSAFDSVGYGGQADYQQPGYGYGTGYVQPTYKTGLGLFIFAIAACVFAGGYGFDAINELIGKIMRWTQSGSFAMLDLMLFLNRIGGLAQMLASITMVVASVFMMLSPRPLFGLGIAMICVSACGAFFLSLYDVMPRLGFGSTLFVYGSGLSIYVLMVLTVAATFILCSIYLVYAFKLKRNQRGHTNDALVSLYAFSISTGLHIILVFISAGAIRSVSIRTTQLSGEALRIFGDFIHIVSIAGMIVGLIFLIKSLFQAKRMYGM